MSEQNNNQWAGLFDGSKLVDVVKTQQNDPPVPYPEHVEKVMVMADMLNDEAPRHGRKGWTWDVSIEYEGENPRIIVTGDPIKEA